MKKPAKRVIGSGSKYVTRIGDEVEIRSDVNLGLRTRWVNGRVTVTDKDGNVVYFNASASTDMVMTSTGGSSIMYIS
jgi:hypothetical protein